MLDAKRRLMVLVLATGLVPVLCFADGAPDENRELLEKWRQDPDHLARLKQNQAVFRKLPADAQERLRKLDRDLADENPAMRARLKGVLDRYNAWLDSLPEEPRRSIETAPDRKTRLDRIRELRKQEFVKRLPKAQQEQIARARDRERAELIDRFVQDDLEQCADWHAAERLWHTDNRPQRLSMLSKDAQQYLEKNLFPMLSSDEEKRLKDAEGRWPRFPRVLIELTDSHPTSVLGPVGPTHVSELTPKVSPKLVPDELRKAEGKWPEFGVAMRKAPKSKFAEKRHFELEPRDTPARAKDFPLAVQSFIEKRCSRR